MKQSIRDKKISAIFWLIPGYRRFSNIAEATMVSEGRKKYFFQYVFVPKNAAESIQIEEIIGTFRKSSYPTVATGLPERSYPQNLWALKVSKGNGKNCDSGVSPTIEVISDVAL